jgi:hypothetical protein
MFLNLAPKNLFPERMGNFSESPLWFSEMNCVSLLAYKIGKRSVLLLLYFIKVVFDFRNLILMVCIFVHQQM